MESNTQPSINTCAICQKPATKLCTSCKEAPAYKTESQNTYYCSSECQKAHWHDHKVLCRQLKTRKAFFRASDMLQDIFYLYREKLFDKVVTRVEFKGGKMYIYEGEYPYDDSGVLLKPDGILQPFPQNLGLEPEDKNSLLSRSMCNEAVGWMTEIVRKLLTGIASSITEWTVKYGNMMREIVEIESTGYIKDNDVSHAFFKVTLTNGGEAYALDLTGAQYGYYTPVTPFQDYVDAHVRGVLHPDRPLGRQRQRMLQARSTLERWGVIPGFCASVSLNYMMYGVLETAVTGWEEEHSTTVQESLAHAPDVFESERKVLLSRISVSLDGRLGNAREENESLRAQIVDYDDDALSVSGTES